MRWLILVCVGGFKSKSGERGTERERERDCIVFVCVDGVK